MSLNPRFCGSIRSLIYGDLVKHLISTPKIFLNISFIRLANHIPIFCIPCFSIFSNIYTNLGNFNNLLNLSFRK